MAYTAPLRPAETMRSATLTLSGVHHAFALQTVVEDIHFQVTAGQTLALVGPSGCGKTTLLHLCAGLMALRRGVLDNGFRNAQCVFQQPQLLPWKTALDNMALGLKARGMARPAREALVRQEAVNLGLSTEDLTKYPHQLSGGMQSRIALGRALVMQPDLLLLDEPFSALDVGLKAELYQRLLQVRQARGVSLLMITHDLMEAVRLADQILVMAATPGRIRARFELARSPLERDDAWVYRHTAALLGQRVVRECFGLPALPPQHIVAAPLEPLELHERDAPGAIACSAQRTGCGG